MSPPSNPHLTPSFVEPEPFPFQSIATHPLKLVDTADPSVLVRKKLQASELPKYYLSLSKARLSSLVVATSVAGYMMAPGDFDPAVLLATAGGTFLVSAAANTVNQIVEVPYDSEMTRTKGRVLVRELLRLDILVHGNYYDLKMTFSF